MTDSRSCDGPGCTYVVPLEDETDRTYSGPSAEYFIKIELQVYPNNRILHFHTEKCLTDWVSARRSERV